MVLDSPDSDTTLPYRDQPLRLANRTHTGISYCIWTVRRCSTLRLHKLELFSLKLVTVGPPHTTSALADVR
jgi:hypothetical protein